MLKDIVHSYNNTKHHTTGMKPSVITNRHVERYLWWHMYKPMELYEKLHEITTQFLLHIRRVTKYVYLIWSKPLKERMMKSEQEKYLKWFNLSVLEYINIIFAI